MANTTDNMTQRQGLCRAGMKLAWLVAVVMLLTVSQASAEGNRKWSMSLLLGGHFPQMKPLSDGLYKAPLLGQAEILVYEGTQTGQIGDNVDQNVTEVRDFRFDNQAPPVGMGALAGVEFGWHPNDRHTLTFGTGSMEANSINRVVGNLPVESYYKSNVVLSDRRDKISYTEYSVGWRYNFWRTPKFRMYSKISAHEIFDIDFREDFVFRFIDSPIPDLIDIRRVMVVEAQTASLFMGQVGIGAEWFLRDWLSLGVEGGYMVGQKKFKLHDVTTRSDFLDSDNVFRTGMPYIKMSDGTLGYMVSGATPQDFIDPNTREQYYRPLRLGFDGWRVGFRVTLYY